MSFQTHETYELNHPFLWFLKFSKLCASIPPLRCQGRYPQTLILKWYSLFFIQNHTKLLQFECQMKKLWVNIHRMKSQLSADWMVTEWWLNDNWMVTGKWISVAFQPPFSDHSVDWMAGTFQWPFSQLVFWKIRLRPTRIEPGMLESRGIIITPREPYLSPMNI